MAGFDNEVMFAQNVDFRNVEPVVGQMTANGQLLIGAGVSPFIRAANLTSADGSVTITNGAGTIDLGVTGGAAINTLSGNTGGVVSPDGAGNISYVGIGETTVAGTPASNLLEIFSPRTAQFVVDPVADVGTHTTIQSAIDDAVSGELIFVRPGVYTENLTLKAGVSLFTDGSATILGEITANYAGTVRLTGFNLQTNGDYFITQTGASACALVLFNCFLNCTNFNGIFSNNTTAGSGIELYQCVSAIAATRTLFEFGGTTLYISGCDLTNGNALSSVASTFSGVNPGIVRIVNSRITFPISTSSSAGVQIFNSVFDTSAVNATCLTINNSNGFLSFKNTYRSGTATAITVTSAMNSFTDTVSSTNATVIGGAGTFTYSLLNFTNGTTIGTTTQAGGQYIGWRTNTAPAAGFIGEQVRSFIGTGAAVVLSDSTNANLTSISLTAGIWDVSLNAGFTGSPTGTQVFAGISTVSATPNADIGDSGASTPTVPTAGSNNFVTIPQYRMSFSSTTTVYAVVRVAFTAGAVSAFGRLSAVRVG